MSDATVTDPTAREILDNVLAAMQDAEEIWGVQDHAQYDALMLAIATEALHRRVVRQRANDDADPNEERAHVLLVALLNGDLRAHMAQTFERIEDADRAIIAALVQVEDPDLEG